MARNFITDSGQEMKVQRLDKETGEYVFDRMLPRYAVWEFGKKGKDKYEVAECSNDLEMLKKKYNVSDDDIEIVEEGKEGQMKKVKTDKISGGFKMGKINESVIEKMLVAGKADEEIIKILAANDELIEQKIGEIERRWEITKGLIGEGDSTALQVSIENINDLKKQYVELIKLIQEKNNEVSTSIEDKSLPVGEDTSVPMAPAKPAIPETPVTELKKETPLPAEAPLAVGK